MTDAPELRARPILLGAAAITAALGIASLAIAAVGGSGASGPPLGAVALVLGAHLAVAGALRLVVALRGPALPGALRWFVAALGALLVVGGLVAALGVVSSLGTLVMIVGIGWIADGVSGLFGGLPGAAIAPRGLAVAACALPAVAGILMLTLATTATAALVVGGVALIVSGALLGLVGLRSRVASS